MTTPTRLSKVLAKLEPLIVDDEQAAHTERVNRESYELEGKLARANTLRTFHLSPVPEIRRALIEGTPLPLATTSVRAVRKWLTKRDVRPWLVLRGGTGCSKSTAAMWALCNGPKPAMWLDAPRAEQVFSAMWGDEVHEQQAALRCSLLVLDDLGTETSNARLGAILVRLLQNRQDLEHRTIVTLNVESLQELYPDARVGSRLEQLAVIVDDKGPDLRRQPKPKERRK